MSENTMTLAQVRNLLFAMSHGATGDEPHEHGVFRRMADAIDAYLTRTVSVSDERLGVMSDLFRDVFETTRDGVEAMRAAIEADRAVRGVVVPREVDLGDAPKGWRNYEAACWATGWNACREVMLTQGPELGVGADVSGKVLSRLRDVLGTDGTVYRDVAALLAQGQRVARDGLTNLYESASKGFHTSETCGPEGKYLHVSKFRTLEDLHAFSDAWTKTMLVQREAVGDK